MMDFTMVSGSLVAFETRPLGHQYLDSANRPPFRFRSALRPPPRGSDPPDLCRVKRLITFGETYLELATPSIT